jgi:hypothetical protein
MVRDAHDGVAGEPEFAPPVLRQPADPPPPAAPVGTGAPVASFRTVWSDRQTRARSLRSWAARRSGRSDRRLLLALAAATEALATQCDLLLDRITAQEAVTADVAGAFGQEIAQLRAEVVHLRRTLTSPGQPDS